MKNKESKRERWIRLMQDYERSSKRVREWCAEVGCSRKSFEYWRYTVRIQETFRSQSNAETKPIWIKAECPIANDNVNAVSDPRGKKHQIVEADKNLSCDFGGVNIFIGIIRVNVARGFDGALLREVVDVLS
jgi:hypothetical protein